MNILEANLQILKERYPELAASYRQPEGVKIEGTRSSYPSLRFKGSLLHSRYDPSLEARRLIDRIDFNEIDTIFLFGFGLGYHLEELLCRADPKTFILVIEPEIDIFFAALSLIDLRNIILSAQIELSVGEDQEKVIVRLSQRFDLMERRRTYTLKHPSSVKLNPSYFEGLATKIQDFINYKVTQARTLSQFGYDFQRNIIRNIPWIVRQPGVDKLFGRFTSLPAIIIAAGPSLDRDLETLKEAKDRALLICVDTALRALLDQGIRPDLVVAIDPQEVNLRYFEDLDLLNLFLVVASIAYWRIGELPTSKFFFLTDHPICRWLAEFDDKGLIDTGGGSVTTASFDLALKLGADPIILIGTDFAYPGGLTHTRSILDDSNNLNSLSKFITLEMIRRQSLARNSVFTIEGAAGEKVSTDKVLYGYLAWLEEKISRLVPSRKIINTSSGARIKGTQGLALRETLNLYCQRELSIKKIIRESWTVHRKIDLPLFIQEIETILEELVEIEGVSRQRIKILEGLKEGCNKGLLFQSQEIGKALNRYEKTMGLLRVVLYAATFNELYEGQRGQGELERDLIWSKGVCQVSSFTQRLFREVRERLNSTHGGVIAQNLGDFKQSNANCKIIN